MQKNKQEELKTIKKFAEENNLSQSFLLEKIKQGLLTCEKKGKSIYLTDSLFQEYKKKYTFSGFMLEKTFPEKGSSSGNNISVDDITATLNTKKEKGAILKEEKVNVDLEEVFVKKWNNEFRKIHDDFKKEVLKKENTKIHSKSNHSIHTAMIATAILFLISLYAVILLPGASGKFTEKLDFFVKSPYEKLNQIALGKIQKENLSTGIIESKDLANYIARSSSKISYPAGTEINLSEDDILGRVAGVEEIFSEDKEKSFFEKIKKEASEIFYKISEKQKNASNKLGESFGNLLSR